MGLAGQGDFYKVISGRWRRDWAFRQSDAENLGKVFELTDEVGLEFDLELDEANTGAEDCFERFGARFETGGQAAMTNSAFAEVLQQQRYAAPGAGNFEARNLGSGEGLFELGKSSSEPAQRPEQSLGMDEQRRDVFARGSDDQLIERVGKCLFDQRGNTLGRFDREAGG